MIVAGLELTRTIAVALGAQSLAGLGAGIIEFAGLADDDRAGADDEDCGDIGPLRHGSSGAAPEWTRGARLASTHKKRPRREPLRAARRPSVRGSTKSGAAGTALGARPALN